jgi:GT2 family glycosyltransferase
MHRDNQTNYTLSVVSHGQASMVRQLLADLERLPSGEFELLLTLNVPEDEIGLASSGFPIRVIRNARPKGFGANHNAAFAASCGAYFVVINPDIRLPHLRLDALRQVVDLDRTGACAPLVVNSTGNLEDSARRFPTIARLLRRVVLRDRSLDYEWQGRSQEVDWVAGMFVMFRREAFQQAGGFDDRRFFMYFEDVDICRRLKRLGWAVRVQPAARVVHDAQRASKRQLKHLWWHLSSAARYLTGL